MSRFSPAPREPSRHCARLETTLVARAYGEPHPDDHRLDAHLVDCAACAERLVELREFRRWIDREADAWTGEELFRAGVLHSGQAELGVTDEERRATRWVGWISAAAMVLVAVLLVVQGRERSVEPTATKGTSDVVPSAAGSFAATDLDVQLDRLELGIAELSVEESTW